MATFSSCSRLSTSCAFHSRRPPPAHTRWTRRRFLGEVRAAVFTPAAAQQPQQAQECSLPTWSEFELGKAAVYWKTTNGLPPTAGEDVTLFYNPAKNKLTPNNEFGIAFNDDSEEQGKGGPPIYAIRIRVPGHAVNLIFSFTNGVEWDGPYRLQFQVPRAWQNKPLIFFNEGLATELNREGACDRAIYPDANVVITSCDMGSFYSEGGDRCKLDIVTGCMDPNSHLFDPLATVDDGSCELESDSEAE